MDREEIARQITGYFKGILPGPDVPLDEDSSLLEGCLSDSLAVVEAVLFLEQTFHIQFSSADINGSVFKDIRSLTDFVASRMAGKD